MVSSINLCNGHDKLPISLDAQVLIRIYTALVKETRFFPLV